MAADATRYREEVERHGFSRTHRQVISWVMPGSSVLEVGCASGYIGKALIESKGCRVTGLEVDAGAAREARSNGLSVIEGSAEDSEFRARLTERYDYVLATDVLEHLREPAPVLESFKNWLRPGGHVIASVPNIATWRMRRQLFFRGDFEYQETGILDRTHVHFFTWETFHKLLAVQGWSVVATMVEEWELPVGRSLLLSAPKTLRKLVDASRSLLPVRVGSVASSVAVGLQERGRALVENVGKRWPNLCASHIAVLLRPSESSGQVSIAS